MTYQYQIEPGNRRGHWQWQITSPDGAPYAWGASARSKKDTEDMLKKTCRRIGRARNRKWTSNDTTINYS